MSEITGMRSGHHVEAPGETRCIHWPRSCGQVQATTETRFPFCDFLDEEIAGARLKGRDVRIEKRQVTYGPWAAVEEAIRGSEGEK